MRAHTLQHVPFEGLGSIEPWLLASGYELTFTRFFADDPIPSPEDIAFLIVMGGPMGVYDEACYPWLAAEKQFIRAVIDAGKPVLGICLGAQLIAVAMGAVVKPNPVKEIGWFDIQAVSDSSAAFCFPETLEVLHWHGDTFELPANAIHLARSAACRHQAFQIGSHVIGLQCHLEVTTESVEALLTQCRGELVSGPFIQTEIEIRNRDAERYRTMHEVMARVLTFLSRQNPSQ